MALAPVNFFSYYVLHPTSLLLTVKEQRVALVASIVLGVLTLGIYHAVCALVNHTFKWLPPGTTTSSMNVFLRVLSTEFSDMAEMMTIASIRSFGGLMAGISDEYEIAAILRAVGELPVAERGDILAAAPGLLAGISNGYERASILRKVGVLLAGISNRYERAAILREVGELPVADRWQITAVAQWLIAGISDGYERAAILLEVGELLAGISNRYERAAILRAVGELPVAKRGDILAAAPGLLAGISDRHEGVSILRKVGVLLAGISNGHASILQVVREFPVAERGDIIAAAQGLLGGISDGYEGVSILKVVIEFPVAKRGDILAAAPGLLAGISNGYERASILRAVGGLLVGISDGPGRAAILAAVGELPVADRGQITAAAQGVMAGISDGPGRATILRAVGGLLAGISNGHASILQVVREFPVAERGDIIAAAQGLLVGISDGHERADILQEVGELSVDARARLTACSPLIPEEMSAVSRAFTIALLGMMPPAQLTNENIHAVIVLSNKIEGDSFAIMMREVFPMIAPDCIPSVVTILHNAIEAHDLPEHGILTYIFNADESLHARSHAYLLEKLPIITVRERAYSLATFIVANSAQLRLSEIDALFQLALQTLSITDPDASRNPKNPYRIYASLKALEATASGVAAPASESLGARLDVAALRAESDKVSASATFARLPHEVTPETLKNLFTAMKARIAALPAAEKAAVNAAIAGIYPGGAVADPLDILESNLTADPYLTRLLSVAGAPTDRVPNDVWEFYNIIQFIQQQSGEVAEGEKLSPREETLIKMSLSIQFCPGGKKEGIGLAYGQIRGMGRTTSSLNEDALKAVLYEEMIMPHLQYLLSDEGPFLREMTGVPAGSPIGQLSHQAIYIKNLLAKRIGLPWDLTFDQHTGVLYDALLGKTVDQALESLFRHFSAENLRDIVQAEVKKRFEDLENPATLEKVKPFHDAIMACLESNPSYFSYHEDDDFHITDLQLTPEGVTTLLTRLGFLEATA